MRKNKLGAIVFLVALSVTGLNAFAANGESVSASISKTHTEAKSTLSIWNCQGAMELDGTNKSDSTNSLYVQYYEQRNYSLDRKETEFLLPKGHSDSYIWTLNSYNSGGAYYVKLNPKGALQTGCNGSGTLYD